MYPQPRSLSLTDLPAAIRQQAALIARFAPGAAEGFLYCAEWVELCLAAHLDERLPLAQASKESGWSYEGLRRQLAERPELNDGEPGAPMIRRRDLDKLGAPRGARGAYGPRKAKTAASAEAPPQPEIVTTRQEEPTAAASESQEGALAEEAVLSSSAPSTSDSESTRPARPVLRSASAPRRGRHSPPRRRDPAQIFDDLLARAAAG